MTEEHAGASTHIEGHQSGGLYLVIAAEIGLQPR
jgi:hypothetical protein